MVQTGRMDPLDLTGKVVIVTGASSGIGAATVRLLHQAGASPVLAARRGDRIEELAKDLGGALAVRTDVTERADIGRLVDLTLDRHGRIDGLVNNAGVALHQPLDTLDLDEFARVLDLNVVSVVAMTQAVNMLTAVARRELAGDGIAVSLVVPFVTSTEFGGGAFMAGREIRPGVTPHSPEYVGKVILRALRTGEERFDIQPGPEQAALTGVP